MNCSVTSVQLVVYDGSSHRKHGKRLVFDYVMRQAED